MQHEIKMASTAALLKETQAPSQVIKCWTHKQTEHDFFISYRVHTEGVNSALSNTVFLHGSILLHIFIKCYRNPAKGLFTCSTRNLQ